MQTGPFGAGIFSPTPVKINATISGGSDDNVNTQQNNKQGSGFTSGNILLDYTFGDPRLQMILNGGAGATYYYEHLSGQSYDIDFTAPKFDSGKKTEPARMTVYHNGVKVHDNFVLRKGPPRPTTIHLQAHGGPVVYRNIWVAQGK